MRDLDDLDGLKEAAAEADGVIHLAFKHEQMRDGDFAGAVAVELAVVHTLDAARVYRPALEKAPAGTRWHPVDDEGIPLREIARNIGDHLGLPTGSIPEEQLREHFGFLAMLLGLDLPATGLETRRVLGWEPTHPGLLEDLDKGDHFTEA